MTAMERATALNEAFVEMGTPDKPTPPPPRAEHQTPLVGLSDTITEEEVRRRLSKLERRKATGPERIAAAELREAVDDLAPGLLFALLPAAALCALGFAFTVPR